jgi:hypothetical protein
VSHLTALASILLVDPAPNPTQPGTVPVPTIQTHDVNMQGIFAFAFAYIIPILVLAFGVIVIKRAMTGREWNATMNGGALMIIGLVCAGGAILIIGLGPMFAGVLFK